MTDEITITSKPYHAIFENIPLRFPPPLAQLSTRPDIFRFQWQFMEAVFRLPDPEKTPALRVANQQQAILIKRFISTCEELAQFDMFSHPSSYNIQFGKGGVLTEVKTDFPRREAVIGAVTQFRQLFAVDEAASFHKIQKIHGKLAHDSDDALAATRSDQLTSWHRAHGKLRGHSLEHMADKEGARLQGHQEPEPLFGQDVSPEELVSQYAYGDLIHWGKQREIHGLRTIDPVAGPLREVAFFDSVIQLSHFYFGYSLTSIFHRVGSLVVSRRVGRFWG